MLKNDKILFLLVKIVHSFFWIMMFSYFDFHHLFGLKTQKVGSIN